MTDELISAIKADSGISLTEKMCDHLREEGLSTENFFMLQESDLKELGFNMGSRKELLQWINTKAGTNKKENQVTFAPFPAELSDQCSSTTSMPTGTSSVTSEILLQPKVNVADILRRPDNRFKMIEGSTLVEKLLKGEVPNIKERKYIVKVLGRYLMKNSKKQDFPTPAEKVAIIKSLVTMFPSTRCETDNGYEHYYDPKTHKGFVEYYIRRRRSRDPDIEKGKYTKQSIPHVLDASEEAALKFMEQNKPTSSNSSTLITFMEKTRSSRRQWIKNTNPDITTILKKYPRFFDMNQAIKEEYLHISASSSLLSVGVRDVEDKILEKAAEDLFSIHDVTTLLESVHDSDSKSIAVLHLLPYFLPCQPRRGVKSPKPSPACCAKLLYLKVEGYMTVNEALEKAQEVGMKQPGIIHLGDEYYIKTDNTALRVHEAANFLDVLDLLFMTFYVFHVTYPYEVKSVYGLFEKLAGIPSTFKSSVVLEFSAALKQ